MINYIFMGSLLLHFEWGHSNFKDSIPPFHVLSIENPYQLLVSFLLNFYKTISFLDLCCHNSHIFFRFLAQKKVKRIREANRVHALETSSAVLIQRRWRRYLVTVVVVFLFRKVYIVNFVVIYIFLPYYISDFILI